MFLFLISNKMIQKVDLNPSPATYCNFLGQVTSVLQFSHLQMRIIITLMSYGCFQCYNIYIRMVNRFVSPWNSAWPVISPV